MDEENRTVDIEDDAFALSKNETLISLYANWPYCSVIVSMNASNATSPAESERLPVFEFVTSLFLLVVVAIPGIAGNFISIFILSRPQMRSSLNVILIGT